MKNPPFLFGQNPSTLFQRIAEGDKTAVPECLDAHGNLVWAAAKKLTRSIAEAETAAQEIFLDLWNHAARFDSAKHDETEFVNLIVRRWLLKKLMKSSAVSTANSASA